MNFLEGEGNACNTPIVFCEVHFGPLYLCYYFPNIFEFFLKALFKKKNLNQTFIPVFLFV